MRITGYCSRLYGPWLATAYSNPRYAGRIRLQEHIEQQLKFLSDYGDDDLKSTSHVYRVIESLDGGVEKDDSRHPIEDLLGCRDSYDECIDDYNLALSRLFETEVNQFAELGSRISLRWPGEEIGVWGDTSWYIAENEL